MSVRPQARKHSGYEAALSGAAFYIYPNAGTLRIAGEHRVDFLQRQTTNDLRSLSPGRFVETVLTSPTGRILDVFFVFMDEHDSLGVLTLPGYARKTTVFLRKRIFFQDKVSLTDISSDYVRVDVEGPSAAEALLHIGFESPAEMGSFIEEVLDGRRLLLFGKAGFLRTGFQILMPSDVVDNLVEALNSAGVDRLSDEDYEILRIESGIPAVGKEISEEYTPLELNMETAISKEKGCYTGQEVIARQITYDKITRRLVGLQLDAAVSPPARVQVDGKLAGEVTSAGLSPRFGALALAILKRPHFAPGTEANIIDEGEQVRGRVCQLPFGAPLES